MKGQYLSLEYVLFFSIGVVLIVSVYFLFSSMSGSVADEAQTYQLEKVGVYVRSAMEKVFVSGNYTGSNVTLNINVPQKLSGYIYSIKTENNTLVVKCSDTGRLIKLNLYGMETKNKVVYSSNGRLKIMYSNGILELIQW